MQFYSYAKSFEYAGEYIKDLKNTAKNIIFLQDMVEAMLLPALKKPRNR
jgi:hypothetical protein